MDEDVCRVCLQNGATIPIFENSVHDFDVHSKLIACVGEEVTDLPGYPRYLCYSCDLTLNEAYQFITKYKESCAILTEQLSQSFKVEIEEIDFDIFDNKSEPEAELNCSLNKEEKLDILYEEPSDIYYTNPEDVSETNIKIEHKKQNKLNTKKKYKTNYNGDKINRIAASILEGEFTFENGEQWRYIPGQRNVKKHRKIPSKTKTVVEITISLPKKKNKVQIKSERKSEFICEICGKAFKRNCTLSQHRNMHNGEKTACPVCSKQFLVHRLSPHLKRMHSTKEYQCAECGKAYGEKNYLRQHMQLVHLKKRNYCCKFCGESFTTFRRCETHTRSVHTGERPEECTICKASFYEKEYLRQHMRLHTGETPYKCPVCNRGYAQNANMKSHIKHNHRISQLDSKSLNNIDPKFLKYMKP